MLNFITWTTNPIAFTLGSLHVYWYGILVATGFMLSYLVFNNIYKTEGLRTEDADYAAFGLSIATIIGLRLGHCFFYEASFYLAHPIEILKVWKGGLASHGGTLGIIIFTLIYTYRRKINLLWLLDRLAVCVLIAASLVRIGNLMNSEIYGCETTLPWGFIFAREGETLPHHPTQIYESLFYLINFVILYIYYKNTKGHIAAGRTTGFLLTSVFTFRFCIEFIKNNQVDFEEDMLLNMGQLLSIPFILCGIALLIYSFLHPTYPTGKSQKEIKNKSLNNNTKNN